VSNVTAIAAGDDYSLALKDDGTVVGWGHGFGVRPFDGRLALSNVVAIAAGVSYERSLALQRDGTVVRFWTGEPVRSGVSNVVAITVSSDPPGSAPLALRRDGTVVLIDGDRHSEMQPPAGLSNVVAVSAGYDHFLALQSDGTVSGWGNNTQGQITGTPSELRAGLGVAAPGGRVLSNIVAIAASTGFSLALKKDGTVVAWGQNARGQTDVPAGLSGVTSIAAGWQHCLAITTNQSALLPSK
jgi:alpha-tubulin suppressor-like RCC1 family protein